MAEFRKMGVQAPAPVVIGTGLIALDMVLGLDASKPPLLMTGGTCGNVLAILGFFGWEPFPVARLNGDAASEKVRRDLSRWGAALDFAAEEPPVDTPIIVQTIRRGRHGEPKHRFSPVCPECGAWFPAFRPITSAAAMEVGNAIVDAAIVGFSPKVFFFDRLSRGAIVLARVLADIGALIVFEPTGAGDQSLFNEALQLAHVLKYSRERLPQLAERKRRGEHVMLEVETRGSAGLRYRSQMLQTERWHYLAARPAPRLADTAGAGDWCTAGILDRLGRGGSAEFGRSSSRKIEEAIRFGQAAAAIACGYEGARGAMYALSRSMFDYAVSRIDALAGPAAVESAVLKPSSLRPSEDLSELCNACS